MKRAVLAASIAGLLAAGCGTPDANFPEPAACPSPAAVPTSRATPGTASVPAMLARIRNGAAELAALRERLRESYPSDTFSRRDAFRPDFARYADATLCLARELRGLTPPPRLEAWKARVDAALDALIAHTEGGREAVRTRNVSEYRDWYRGVDARIDAVEEAAAATP
ncbi:hypothetical protein [Tepidiforma sp.]|uniref:hypothetical protein n=1 Tax=Tepidiforma sp. TaxID=2682230 RepID=UPI002ADD780D|nr:hypothetical protein [Tepidiforma sp.]